jgi:peptidoglycan/LPS O-acetylase OafA/YrhL
VDGLRGLAILGVLVAHGSRTHGSPVPPGLRSLAARAGVGVDLFFVLSGFLITLLLLRERRQGGRVSVGGFYLRRAFRILPAYAAYLLAVLALTRLGAAVLRPADWWGALTWTINWLFHPAWEVGHIWSLCLEEHFYLLWPLLFALGPRWAARFAWGCILLSPLVRLGAWQWFPGALPLESTLTRLDTIAVGCVLAFAVHSPGFRRRVPGAGRGGAWLGVLAVLALAGSLLLSHLSYRFELLLGVSLNAFALAAVLWVCVNRPAGLAGRLLGSRPLVLLGTLSYSLYLWQQVFLNRAHSGWACRWPVNVGLALLAAAASYLVVERPFLRLKEHLRGRKARAPASRPLRSQGDRVTR